MLRADERPQLGCLVEGIADADLPGPRRDRLHEVLVHRLLDEQARPGRAALAVEREDLGHDGVDGSVEVRVREHDDRRLAAELEREPLERRSGVRHDGRAGRRLAGERDQVDAGMGDERRAGRLAEAVHDVEDALGQTDLVHQLGEPSGGQRRPLGRLEDDRVPGREARRDPPRRQHQRSVPGHDQPGDAHRLVDRVVDELVADLVRLAGKLRNDAGEVVEVLGGARGEPAHLPDRHADVEDLERDELVRGFPDRRRDPAQDGRALRRLQPRPRPLVERAASGYDRIVDVRREPFRDLGDGLVRGRVERLERPSLATRPKLARHVVQLRADLDPGRPALGPIGCLAHPATRLGRSRAAPRRRGSPRCAPGSPAPARRAAASRRLTRAGRAAPSPT